jgi:hypothetical protein
LVGLLCGEEVVVKPQCLLLTLLRREMRVKLIQQKVVLVISKRRGRIIFNMTKGKRKPSLLTREIRSAIPPVRVVR